jgi:MFS family permease
VPGIILLTLIQGIINAFDVTCRQSLMMEMVEHKDDLPNAIALNATMTNFARITGPAVAGIVLSTLGEDVCFFSNFLSYIPVLISLFMMRLKLAPVLRSDKSIWFGLKEGFSYVSGNADLGSVLLMLAVSSLFVMPFNTLIPMFAKDIFNGNAETFSWFESAAGIGAIISAIYLANLKTANGMIRIMIMASLIFGVSVLFLAYTGWLPMALAFMTIAGIGMMALSSSVNTYIQTHAAPEMRSRAISYYIMAYQGMIPLGSLLVGLIAHKLGPQMTVAIEGVLGLVATILFFFYRKRISLRRQVSGHLFLAKGNAA